MFTRRYAKAWAGLIGTALATAGVAWSGGDPVSIESAATAVGGGVSTLFVLFGPRNEG